MKTIPMIFNSDMVKAIVNGRKTVTRRPMKQQPPEWCKRFGYTTFTPERHISGRGSYEDKGPAEKFFKQPFFKDDLIYVRETWADAGANAPELTLYKANYPEHVPAHYENVPSLSDIKWTPSIHMPRWASRLTLKVTDVRIEKISQITEEQAIKEGMMTATEAEQAAIKAGIGWYEKPYIQFKNLWERIYGEWSCYVWVIEFEVIHLNVDTYLKQAA
ncbi:hypothetical protein [Vibrio splendidus]|uniref:hypothetical protein n=1 Tax=Vibrio splendidus TaxID=29497 RepID=UPI003D0DE047